MHKQKLTFSNTLATKLKPALPCGCIPGEYLCPLAVSLWSDAAREFDKVRTQPPESRRWAAYDEAMAKYRRHMRYE